MTSKPKGGDGGEDFDFSKYGFGKRGSKGFTPKKEEQGKVEPEHDTGSGGFGDGGGPEPGGFGNFDWEPEPNDEDLRQAREETERMMATEIEGEFEGVFRSLANKIMWDIIWSMVRPDRASTDAMISEIIACGTRQVMAQLNEENSRLNEEDKEFMNKVVARAIAGARSAFERAFSGPMISDTFAKSVVKSIRKNLKK